MKTKTVKALFVAVTILSLAVSLYGETVLAINGENTYVYTNNVVLKDSELNIKPAIAELKDMEISAEEIKIAREIKEEIEEVPEEPIVYDGMTLDQLAEKLNRSLNSTIAGQGHAFATYSVELGVDPYLAVAIVLHETGCKWNCSSLTRNCYNVGGMKGGSSSKCNGGSYARFSSLDEGIKAYMNNLHRNYVSKGLTTANAMGPKYAASESWASKVNAYIESIKAN